MDRKSTGPDSGGAAFPGSVRDNSKKLRRNPGMTLRDWFAGKAMVGLIANPQNSGSATAAAEIAYDIADAMIAARRGPASRVDATEHSADEHQTDLMSEAAQAEAVGHAWWIVMDHGFYRAVPQKPAHGNPILVREVVTPPAAPAPGIAEAWHTAISIVADVRNRQAPGPDFALLNDLLGQIEDARRAHLRALEGRA